MHCLDEQAVCIVDEQGSVHCCSVHCLDEQGSVHCLGEQGSVHCLDETSLD